MVLATYGRSTGFALDPIEKKPLYHVLPGSTVLSFGTAGCNLACKFCQNWSTSTARDVAALSSSATPGQIATMARQAGAAGVAYTYNDPIIFAEYAIDTAQACRQRGLVNVAVTAGYICAEARADFFSAMDAVNVDLKSLDASFYRKVTGGRLEVVQDTLVYLVRQTDVWVEITTLLVPGLNDSETEVGRLVEWVAGELGPDVPLHFTAFHPAHRMRDRKRTPTSTLRRARQMALDAGMNHVYTGNVVDPDGSTTACSSCGQDLIVRSGFGLLANRLDPIGRCPACAAATPGLWSVTAQRPAPISPD